MSAEFLEENQIPQPTDTTKYGTNLSNLKSLNVGSGQKTMKTDDNGLFLGADNFADAPFSVSFLGALIAKLVTITGGTIKYGKTSFSDSTNAGYYIGNEGLYIGSASDAKYIKYDISAGTIAIRGSLNADDITAGTIVGRTFKATGGSTGVDVWVENDGYLRFRYDNSNKAWISALSTGDMRVDSDGGIDLVADDGLYFEYNEDGGGNAVNWYNDGAQKMVLDDNNNLRVVDGEIYAEDFNYIDYAEYFEATKEFSQEKIPVGTSVVLENGKIRPAKKNEIPFGVISKTSFLVLGAGGNEWVGKYERDSFGDVVYEEVDKWYLKVKDSKILKGWCDESNPPEGSYILKKKRKKISRNYDPKKKYIPREKRPEWNNVGLLGRIKILKGQPTNPNWIKLRDISDKVEEWLIK